MRKVLLALATFILSVHATVAQTGEGTAFLDNVPLYEALQQAKNAGKMLFVDCYTTWCGPCKAMANNVFPQPLVGNYMNEHFVSLKIDMEKGEGPELLRKFGVRAYPTFLILESDGSERGRLVGARPAEEFVNMVSGVLEGPSLSQLNSQWERGDRSEAFLRQYFTVVEGASMQERSNEVASLLLKGKKEQLLTDSLLISAFQSTMPDVFSETFQYVWDHRQQFEERYGEKFGKDLERIWEYTPYLLISGRGKEAVLDEKKMQAYIDLMNQKGIEHREEMAAQGYINYALTAQRWKDVKRLVEDYRKQFKPNPSLLQHWGIPVLNAKEGSDKDLPEVQQWMRALLEEVTKDQKMPAGSIPAYRLR